MGLLVLSRDFVDNTFTWGGHLRDFFVPPQLPLPLPPPSTPQVPTHPFLSILLVHSRVLPLPLVNLHASTCVSASNMFRTLKAARFGVSWCREVVLTNLILSWDCGRGRLPCNPTSVTANVPREMSWPSWIFHSHLVPISVYNDLPFWCTKFCVPIWYTIFFFWFTIFCYNFVFTLFTIYCI